MPDEETLTESNDRRLRDLAGRGCGVNPQSLNDLRLLSYIEVLLGDSLDRAEGHFQSRLADQLTVAEANADQFEAERRKMALVGRPLG